MPESRFELETGWNSFPTVVETLGFSRTITLVLTCPPYLIAGAVTALDSWSSGKPNERTWLHNLQGCGRCRVCGGATPNTAGHYGMGLSLVVAGLGPNFERETDRETRSSIRGRNAGFQPQTDWNSFPTVVETLGFNRTITLVLTCPPYLIAGAITILVSWSSGKMNERTWHITVSKAVAVVGFVSAAATLNTAWRCGKML